MKYKIQNITSNCDLIVVPGKQVIRNAKNNQVIDDKEYDKEAIEILIKKGYLKKQNK